MGRNTAQAGQRWSRRGPKPEPVAPSWETLGMAQYDGEDDPACFDPGCWAIERGGVTLHAYPDHNPDGTFRCWLVLIDPTDDDVDDFRSEAAAFDFCRRLLALPPTNKENR